MRKLNRAQAIEFFINYFEKITFENKIHKSFNEIVELQKEKLVIFDVGANIGQTCNLYQKIFKIEDYFAFEPNLIAYNKLRQKFPQIKSFNLAVGDKSTDIDFYISPISVLSTVILPKIESKRFVFKQKIIGKENSQFQKTIVKQITIDDFVGEHNITRIDLLKIDVEGFELQVLKGSEKTLRSGIISIIQLEQHFDDQRINNDSEIRLILQKFGFNEIFEVKHYIGKFSEIIFSNQSPINLA